MKTNRVKKTVAITIQLDQKTADFHETMARVLGVTLNEWLKPFLSPKTIDRDTELETWEFRSREEAEAALARVHDEPLFDGDGRRVFFLKAEIEKRDDHDWHIVGENEPGHWRINLTPMREARRNATIMRP